MDSPRDRACRSKHIDSGAVHAISQTRYWRYEYALYLSALSLYWQLASVTIIFVSRLAYRKGIDLFVAIAPRICRRFPNVRFVVGKFTPLCLIDIVLSIPPTGGDGPKLINILQMREKHVLQNRIELLGPVKHKDVPKVCLLYSTSADSVSWHLQTY